MEVTKEVETESPLDPQFIRVPDVGRAIHLNHVSPKVDPEKRMSALDVQRRETYAIRELWKTLQQRRARRTANDRHNDTNEKPAAQPGRHKRGVFRTNHGSGPYFESSWAKLPQEVASRQGCFTDRGQYPAVEGHHSPCRSKNGRLTDRHTESAPARSSRSVRDEDIPYHTAITMPPDARSKSSVGFNALNRKLMSRLPDIYDTGYRPPGYAKCDIREWKNEIRKIVPQRPIMFLPANTPTRPLSTLIPPELDKPRDKSVLFRTTVDPMYGKHQEYVVDPEWFSEKIKPESVQRRAHCVYTWNV